VEMEVDGDDGISVIAKLESVLMAKFEPSDD